MLLLQVNRSVESEGDLQKARQRVAEIKAAGKGESMLAYANVKYIVVACDAGMGSSAMGATILAKQLKETGLDIKVENKAIDNLDGSEDLVITQKLLTERARAAASKAIHLSIGQFLDRQFYRDLVRKLQEDQRS